MQISRFDFVRYFNMHIKEDKTPEIENKIWIMRRKNPLLDRALYEYDEAVHTDIMTKVDIIASKIAKGQGVTNKERAFILKHAPDKLRDAEMAKDRAKQIARRLKQAKTKSEKNAIMNEVSVEVQLNMQNEQSDYAELLLEALAEFMKKGDESTDESLDSQDNPLDELFVYANELNNGAVEYQV